MRGLIFTAPSSGSGKTLITAGIIRALFNSGVKVAPFKSGPDYIDSGFLALAAKHPCGNLDLFLTGDDGPEISLGMVAKNESEDCLAVIEGAMGYLDGMGATPKYSSADNARAVNAPAVLIFQPSKSLFTNAAQIKGIMDHPLSNIVGVIFNRIKKELFPFYKEAVEGYCHIPVLGFIPEVEELNLPSRHLGLVQIETIAEREDILERAAKVVSENLNLEDLKELFAPLKQKFLPDLPSFSHLKVAIAKDLVCSFYYQENLKLLERTTSVEYFSLLNSPKLPKADLIYLGGGYPELYLKELSLRRGDILAELKDYVENGGYLFAECGGFMLLNEKIESVPLTSIFAGECYLKERQPRFGYIEVILKEDLILGKKGDSLVAHEFHKSVTNLPEEQTVFEIKKPNSNRGWSCGYQYKNCLGGYPHFNFLGNLKAFQYLLNKISSDKSNKDH